MKPNPTSRPALEAALRRHPPVPLPPADLHGSILRAVRAAAESPRPQPTSLPARLGLAAGLAVLLALGVWWGFLRSGGDGHLLKEIELALPGTQNIPERASAAMVAPLSQELEYLNRDFSNAMNFLMASVP